MLRAAAATLPAPSRKQTVKVVVPSAGPSGLVSEATDEPGRKRAVLFRRSAGPVRLTIFDGAHESDFPPGVRWLAEQENSRR